ncbi:hypothetical protein, partial [Escherichia sp. MOD1-EC7003]|uniref:hypothetical protein n=1 Tax=Escherichia sp. MOD1-EC7003 TaxID=2093900 RepID=UPI001A7E05EB
RSQNSMPVFFYPPITGDSSAHKAGFFMPVIWCVDGKQERWRYEKGLLALTLSTLFTGYDG